MSWQTLASFGLQAGKTPSGGDKIAATASGGNATTTFGEFKVGAYESETERIVKVALTAGALFLGFKWLKKYTK